MFDLTADRVAIGATLPPDPVADEAGRRGPGLRVPGAWNGFELAIRAILGQQVTVKGATALAGRISRVLGSQFTVVPTLEPLRCPSSIPR